VQLNTRSNRRCRPCLHLRNSILWNFVTISQTRLIRR